MNSRVFRKVLKGVVAFGGIGGILASISFYLDYKEKQEINYKNELRAWQNAMQEWEKWLPNPISEAETTIYVEALDLDTGQKNSNHNLKNMDIYFSGGSVGWDSYLRVLHGVSWYDRGLIDPSKINYRELRNAKYTRIKHAKSNYYDLFHEHVSNAPAPGHIYFLKTAENNYVVFQIKRYIDHRTPDRKNFYRELRLKYTTYPFVQIPMKPRKPRRP